MKKEKGITLSSLVIYIIVMMIVIGVMSSISLMFYNNAQSLTEQTQDMIEYNNFNNYFINEIKTANNKVDQISEDGTYILFTSGNSFSLQNSHLYFNDVEIASNIDSIHFSYYMNEQGEQVEDIITVNIKLPDYQKQMDYKIEEIY